MSCVYYHMFTVFFLIAFSFCSVFVSIFHPDLLYSVTVWVYPTVTIFHYAGDKFIPDFHIVLKFFI